MAVTVHEAIPVISELHFAHPKIPPAVLSVDAADTVPSLLVVKVTDPVNYYGA